MRRWTLFFVLLLATLGVARRAPWSGWVDGVRIASPQQAGRLVLYPLSGAPRQLPRCLTLDVALDREQLSVREISEGGRVNQVRLENRGERPIFIMAGEVLSGARQDRILQKDVWLPGYSGPVIVSAFCVEHGRWSYKSDHRHFESKGTLSNVKVRQSAMVEGQDKVWASVAETCRAGKVEAPTGSLNAVYEDAEMRRRIVRWEDDLRNLPDDFPTMNGAALQVGGRILAVDLFPDRRIFLALWPKLLKSYALEAAISERDNEDFDRGAVRDFLTDLAESDVSTLSNPGEGVLFGLRDSRLDGQGLVLDEGLVHLQAMSRLKVRPYKPSPSPSPWPPAIEMLKPTRPRS